MSALFAILGFVTSYWYVVVAVVPVALALLQIFFGIKALSVIKAIFEWLKTPGGQITGAVVAIVLIGVSLVQWGKNMGEAECNSAELQARINAITLERDTALARLKSESASVAALAKQLLTDQTYVNDLRGENARLALQSTKPGAKHDPQALLDDRCNYTVRGARRVRP